MGKHAMPRKPSTMKRTVVAGAIAGCSAIGLGALSELAAPTANASPWGHHTSGHNTTNSNNSNNGVAVSVSTSNGNTKQSNTLSGNQINGLQLGVLGANTAANTSIGNISAANGNANVVSVIVAQSTITTTNPVCLNTCS